MTSLPLIRTEYWNTSTGTVRTGDTAHGESLTDMESYLLPLAQMLASGFYTPGVVEGLTVSAVTGQAGLAISPGLALDAGGSYHRARGRRIRGARPGPRPDPDPGRDRRAGRQQRRDPRHRPARAVPAC